MATQINTEEVIKEYTPRLVLYPEIQPNSEREMNPYYPHEAPLAHDYHPRDIRMVLENMVLHGRVQLPGLGTTSWETMLDKMERGGYESRMDLLPGVRPDEKEEFWKVYAAIDKSRAEFQRRCYARVVPGTGPNEHRLVVQYWYAYFYNDFWNTHEMDFEVVMIILKVSDGNIQPTVCAYSAHKGGHWLPWEDVDKDAGTKHPMVYVANGSHANYFYGQSMFPTAPPAITMAADLLKTSKRLVDYTTSAEDGESLLVEASEIPQPGQDGLWTGDWRWLNHENRWGSSGKWYDLEFGDSAPGGPPNSGDKWDHPLSWIDVSCTRAPGPGEALLPSRI